MPKKKRNHDQAGSPGGAHQTATENDSHAEVKFEGLHAARPRILSLFDRILHLHSVIDDAFGGHPFLPDLAPDAPMNRHRFTVYLKQQEHVLKLFRRALELWMTSCGFKAGENWIPLLVEQMKQEALRRDRQTKT